MARKRGVLSNPYKGVRGDRYQFMKDHMPEELARMDEADETQDYLNEVERRYIQRSGELYPTCLKECGGTEELKRTDCGAYLMALERAGRMAWDLAYKDVIEAL